MPGRHPAKKKKGKKKGASAPAPLKSSYRKVGY